MSPDYHMDLLGSLVVNVRSDDMGASLTKAVQGCKSLGMRRDRLHLAAVGKPQDSGRHDKTSAAQF